MEKKSYNAPEVKFHQLRTKSSMLAGSPGNGDEYTSGGKGGGSNNNDDDHGSYYAGDDLELGAKGGFLNFDED